MSLLDQTIDKLRQRQQLLAILLFSLVAIIIWIVISLVTSQQTTAISAELRQMAEPLTPSLNTQIIEQIEQETYYPSEELRGFPVFRVISDEEQRAAASSAPASPSATAQPDQNTTNPLPEEESPVGESIEATDSGSTL